MNADEPIKAARNQSDTTEREGVIEHHSSDPNATSHESRGSKPPDDGNTASGLRQLVKEHRRPLLLLVGLGLALVFVFVVLPQLAGFGKSLHRLRYGNKVWLVGGVGLESISLFGYMALLRMTFSCDGVKITWGSSYQITMAGTVATKVLSAGGAGGIALTVWALQAAGLSARSVARRMTSFEILLYAVFMVALVVFGVGLGLGLLPGHSRSVLTLLPAAFGAIVIVLALGLGYAADRAQRGLSALAHRARRGRKLLEKLVTVPRTLHDGVDTTRDILRKPGLGLSGAIIYWAFDIATLWVAFRAFGASPEIAVLVLGYYIGQLANVLPLPGGIGGVEGGMIGSFIAFGVNGSTAALAVLAYRLISFWLPIVPGLVAYLRLRALVSRWNDQHDEQPSEGSSQLPARA